MLLLSSLNQENKVTISSEYYRTITILISYGKNLDEGESIYRKRCLQCHGDKAQGNNEAFFSSLKGQHHAYLLRQLKWIRDGYRKNANEAMVAEVKVLSDDELNAVADYLSRL